MSFPSPITCAALLPANKSGAWWLFDVKNGEAMTDWRSYIEHCQLLICLDAHHTLKELDINPEKVICLSTIKKLIAKQHTDEIKLPEWTTPKQAFLWLEKVLVKSFQEIERRQIENLVHLECSLIPVLVHMEQAGFPFCKDKWLEKLESLETEQKNIKQKLEPYFLKDDGFLLFGDESVDLNQTSMVKQRLEEIIGKKLPSTSASVLKDIDHDAARLLIRYREHERMLTTYGEHFLPKIVNDRIHASFVGIASASGRSTCTNPNLQALPNDKNFQECVQTKPPFCLRYFDYGGFELRILAALSEDDLLCQLFNDDKDIHAEVAKSIFGVEVTKDINPDLRAQAKILNFGIIYGMSEKSLAEQLKTSFREAQKLMENYFKRFKKVKEFLEQQEHYSQTRGYVETILGRRAYFFNQETSSMGHVMRVARNIPVQGTGAEIAKLALVRLYERIKASSLDVKIVNMVHDEIVIECIEEQHLEIESIVKKEMTSAFNALLPKVKAEVSVS